MSNIFETSSKISTAATIMPGAYIGSGVVVDDDVIIGPNACVLESDAGLDASSAIIRAGARIGANATILPGVIVGERAFVKPGSVVTRSVPPLAIVEGNPAIIVGYVATLANEAIFEKNDISAKLGVSETKVAGVTLHRFRLIPDLRGSLSVGEFEREIPFSPKRYFLVFDVPTAETRGEHAHVHCQQFLVCVKGTCSVVADDGKNREEFVLDSPDLGLYLPPMTWGIQYRYSSDAVLLVFTSDYYDPDDYIRDYSVFRSKINLGK